jgi:hypothetical protein
VNIAGGYTPSTKFEAPPTGIGTGACGVTASSSYPLSGGTGKQDIKALHNKLSPLVRRIMKSLSKQTMKLPKNSPFRISDNDRKISGTISFILDQANKNGDERLSEISNRIQAIIQGYSNNPNQSRYQLSEITHEMFMEHLPETKHAKNETFMKQWKKTLDTRLQCYKRISDNGLSCPIGSFGEEPPKWFAYYTPPKSYPADYFLHKSCRDESRSLGSIVRRGVTGR